MNKKKCYVIVVLILIFIINCIYMYTYCKPISIENICLYITNILNFVLINLYKLIEAIILMLLEKDIFKLIIIIFSILYFLERSQIISNILELIKLIKRIDINGIVIEMSKLIEVTEEQNQLVNDLHENKTNGNIGNEEFKRDILQRIVDSPNIVELIDKYLYGNCKKFKIPRVLVPNKFKLSDINLIFDTEMTSSQIIIKSMKKKDIVKEVFDDLIKKGIIHSKFYFKNQ